MPKQTKLNQFEKWMKARQERAFPLLYLLICILAFGLFIPFLGFYWDDWPTIFYTHSNRIAQLVNHFSYDRPFSVWAYYLIGRLGTAPIAWHVGALLQRWALVVALAWALKPLWPKQNAKILYIALIFAIYPGYYVQPLSVIFAPHLAAYIFFFVSLGAMGRAISQPKYFRRYTLLALAAAFVQVFTLEYYVGLELIRPLYIWFVLTRLEPRNKRPFAKTMRLWAPYLLVFLAWFAWRLFLLKLPSEPYPLALSRNPLTAAGELFRVGVQDLIYVLFTAWTETLRPALFTLATRVDWLAWGIAAASALLIGYLLLTYHKVATENKTPAREETRFAKQAMLLGLFAFSAGMAPVWVIGERIAQGDYSQRYLLIAIFGAAIFLVALITYLIPVERNRILLIALLVGLAIGNHLRQTNVFRQDWETQRNFYWQLAWRAPAIQSNTALISFDRVTHWTGEPLLGDALNTLYPPHAAPPAVDLWNFELTRSAIVERILAGEKLENDYRGLTFSTEKPDDLLFFFPSPEGCLWVLSALDTYNEYLPFENRELVAHSNLDNIVLNVQAAPDESVFGAEPAHTWCYYFEKADLARQQGQWDTVLSLMAGAQQQGLEANVGIEWLPLVEAYARTGDWAAALDLSATVHRMHTKNDAMICALWGQIIAATDSAEAADVFAEVGQLASCNE